jgi:hypothetical protein
MRSRPFIVFAVIGTVVLATCSSRPDVGLGATRREHATLSILNNRAYLHFDVLLPQGYSNPFANVDEDAPSSHTWTRDDSPVIRITVGDAERRERLDRCAPDAQMAQLRLDNGSVIGCYSDGGYVIVRTLSVDTPLGEVPLDCAVYGDPSRSREGQSEAYDVCASLTTEVEVPGFEPRQEQHIKLGDDLDVDIMVPDRMANDGRMFWRRDRTAIRLYAQTWILPVIAAFDGCDGRISITTLDDGWLETCTEVVNRVTRSFSRLQRWSSGSLRITCWTGVEGDVPVDQYMASCGTLRVRRGED